MLAKTPHAIKPYSLSAAFLDRRPAYLIYRGREFIGVTLGRTWVQARERAERKIREREGIV